MKGAQMTLVHMYLAALELAERCKVNIRYSR